MYPDSYYNTGGAQYPMWYQLPPEYYAMPNQSGCPGGDCGVPQQPQGGQNQSFGFAPMEGYAYQGYEPPPPPDFSGYNPAQT